MTKLDKETIEAYEAAGAKRWTIGEYDRLYISIELLGLKCWYYNSGNVSSAEWCGDEISNANARRILASKVYVDVSTGQLHVNADVRWQDDIESKAREFVSKCLADE